MPSMPLPPPLPPSTIHTHRRRRRHHFCCYTSLGSKSYHDDDGERRDVYGAEETSAKKEKQQDEESAPAPADQKSFQQPQIEEEFVVRRRKQQQQQQQPRIRNDDMYDDEYEYGYDNYYDSSTNYNYNNNNHNKIYDGDVTTYENQFPRRRDERNGSDLSRYYDYDYDYARTRRRNDDDDGDDGLMYYEGDGSMLEGDGDYDGDYYDEDDFYYDTDDSQEDFRETSYSAGATSRDGGGNYWSNPTKRLDRPPPGLYDDDGRGPSTDKPRRVARPSTNQQQEERRRRSTRRMNRSPNGDVGGANSNRRSSITMNQNDSPTAFKNFYDRLFWSGFDPDDPDDTEGGGGGSSSVGDKTAFGGTKGKFNGLAFYRAAEENISNRYRPRRRPPTLRQDYRSRNINRLPLPPASFPDDDDDDDGGGGGIEGDERYNRSRLRNSFDYQEVEDSIDENDVDPYFDTGDKIFGYDVETGSTRNGLYQSKKVRPENRTITPPKDSPMLQNNDELRRPRMMKKSRKSPARRRARSYQIDDDYYDNDDDDDDYFDSLNSRDNFSRFSPRRSSTNRDERYDASTDDYFDGDDDDDFFPRDDESARRFQRRRQRSSKQEGFLGWSPKDALGNFIGSDWNQLADEYDSKMGLRRKRERSPGQTSRQETSRRRQRQQSQPQRGAPPAGPRVSFRDYPDRPGYAYRYVSSEEDDDEDTVLDIDTPDDSQSEFSDLPIDVNEEADDVDNNDKMTDSKRLSDSDGKKELSWEERVLAVERVPPATVPAWGPQGELPMNARMKAVVDALQDIETARRKVQRRKKKKSIIEDDIAALKVDIKRDRVRLEQGGGRRSWELEEQLRENELEADDLSLDLRKMKLQIEYAQAELDELQERHWAVLSFYSPELAASAVEEALDEFSGGARGRAVGGSSPSASTRNGDTRNDNTNSNDDNTIADVGGGDGTESSPASPVTDAAADAAAAGSGGGGGGPINGAIGVNGVTTDTVSSDATSNINE